MLATPPDSDDITADQARRRASAGADRRGLRHVVIAVAIIFGGMALLIAADVWGVESRLTSATAVGMSDRWNMKGGHECVTTLTTGYGYAQISTRNLCHYAPWHLGDTAELEVRRSRFTGTILVTTLGTIFEDTNGKRPKS